MNGLSTITQKGQVVIPINLRKALKLSPQKRVSFELIDNAIIIKPVLSIDEAFGMFKTAKKATEEDFDKAIRDAVVEKFRTKFLKENS